MTSTVEDAPRGGGAAIRGLVAQRADLAAALGAMGLTFATMAVVIRLWRIRLGVPFVDSGDQPLMQMLVKSVLDHGWYETNSSLGAPAGQQLYDYPVLNGDNLNVVLFQLIGLGTRSSAGVLNLFYLLTYPLAALTAFLVLRAFTVSRIVAVVCAALYALLPYHFLRGEAHLLLSAYYAVPLGAYLVLSVLAGRPLFTRRAGTTRSGLLAYVSRRSLLTVALCLIVASASGSFYYSAFTLVLLAVATAVAAISRWSRAALAAGGISMAIVLGASILELAPALVYRAVYGTNHEAGRRASFESESYSLRLTQLVLPIPNHRFGALARLRQHYERHLNPTEAVMGTLGAVGTIGFLLLLGSVLLSVVGPGKRAPPALYRYAGVATLAAFLVGTTGGFSTLIGALYPQLRAWNRLSIFIAFFGLLAVALLLDALGRTIHARPLFLGILAGVFLLGALDQTSDAFVPRYGAVAAEYSSDGAFVRDVERQLPNGASVYQLPYMAFPEPPYRPGMDLYDLARGYLHSHQLRWSYAAMKGRPADRWAALADHSMQEVVPAVSKAGFQGITIDRFGYSDRAASIEAQLRSMLNVEPLVSPDARLSFFSLRGYRAA